MDSALWTVRKMKGQNEMTDPAPGESVIVAMGNRAAIEMIPDPTDSEEAAAEEGRAVRKVPRQVGEDGDKRCTTVVIPAGTKTIEALVTLTNHGGVWANHSSDEAPAWVASTHPTLGALLAEHYGCELRDYDPDHQPTPAAPAAPSTPEG